MNAAEAAAELATFRPTISRARRMWNTFIRNRTALIGLIMVIFVVFISAAASLIAWHTPLDQSTANRLAPPGETYLLGRDEYGRDVFARLLYAGRVSLVVGVSSVAIGGIIGIAMGIVAGYIGGRVEIIIMRLIDIMMAFPSLILGLVVMAVLGAGMRNLILAIGIVFAPGFARVVHATTLSLKSQEFVEAARSIGASHTRIMVRHILPNNIGEIVVLASLWTASAIRIEASLSFIGLGVSPPTPTWGNMIREGTAHLFDAPWLSIFPGIAIFITVLGFNLLGDGLRDILDPRLQE
jgi:peptide/nickel transport system permease protein